MSLSVIDTSAAKANLQATVFKSITGQFFGMCFCSGSVS